MPDAPGFFYSFAPDFGLDLPGVSPPISPLLRVLRVLRGAIVPLFLIYHGASHQTIALLCGPASSPCPLCLNLLILILPTVTTILTQGGFYVFIDLPRCFCY
jgi:hypothetical protein